MLQITISLSLLEKLYYALMNCLTHYLVHLSGKSNKPCYRNGYHTAARRTLPRVFTIQSQNFTAIAPVYFTLAHPTPGKKNKLKGRRRVSPLMHRSSYNDLLSALGMMK